MLRLCHKVTLVGLSKPENALSLLQDQHQVGRICCCGFGPKELMYTGIICNNDSTHIIGEGNAWLSCVFAGQVRLAEAESLSVSWGSDLVALVG